MGDYSPDFKKLKIDTIIVFCVSFEFYFDTKFLLEILKQIMFSAQG